MWFPLRSEHPIWPMTAFSPRSPTSSPDWSLWTQFSFPSLSLLPAPLPLCPSLAHGTISFNQPLQDDDKWWGHFHAPLSGYLWLTFLVLPLLGTWDNWDLQLSGSQSEKGQLVSSAFRPFYLSANFYGHIIFQDLACGLVQGSWLPTLVWSSKPHLWLFSFFLGFFLNVSPPWAVKQSLSKFICMSRYIGKFKTAQVYAQK